VQQQPQSIIITIAIFALVYFLIIFGRRRLNIPIWLGIALSQVLSNVPFVAIYNTVMINNGFPDNGSANTTSQWMMLAAASTIAGNLTILAAASNIIIIEAAESRGIKTFTFFEFLKVGALVTIANIVIYYLFITYL
jgi:Na+/H+ antiporter NhaD/arsenite permease-like protein